MRSPSSEPTPGSEALQARRRWSPPDGLTLLRIPLAVALLAWDHPMGRVGIVAVAALTDVVDGIWARRIGGSRWGAVLDPIADKVFIACAYWLVWRSGALPLLEVIGVLLRDLVAILGFLGSWVFRRPTALPARAGGKAVTIGQLLTLVAFLLQSDLLRPLAWATAAIAVYAIADYGRAVWDR